MKWKSGEKAKAWLGLAAIACAGLGLRCTQLEDRPMHTDEAVHAVVLGEMLKTGSYRYNPHDSHGPLLYDLSYPLLRGLGLRDLPDLEAWHLRLISALVGAATIFFPALWVNELGATAMMISGLLLALAAPFVYYQRYFIHEGLFVLLTLALLRCLWSWAVYPRSIRAGLGVGATAGLLFATKETAPLVLPAMGLAAVGAWVTRSVPRVPRSPVAPGNAPAGEAELCEPQEPSSPAAEIHWATDATKLRGAGRSPVQLGNEDGAMALFLSALAFVVVAALFYSSFGMNPRGLLEVGTAVLRFLHRAGGEGHEKPWWTYLSWIFVPHFYTVPWSGWIIFGLAAAGTILRWNLALIRMLFFFTLAMGIIYSFIPYKTPWLELNILAPAILPAGVGAVGGWQAAGKLQFRLILLWLAALALLGLVRETREICFAHPADVRNPLAYSPTVPDVRQLAVAVTRLKLAHPNEPANFIEIISTDYWPLPWYLRRLQPAGYWNQIPPEITGDIVITSPDLLYAVQAKLGPGWNVRYFGLRPEVLAIVLSKPAPHE